MKRILTILIASFAISCTDNSLEQWKGEDNPGGGNEPEERREDTPVLSESQRWAALADSCTHVLVDNFLDKKTGTFWSTPRDIEHGSQYIYWQQAHALDVIISSYLRIKESNPALAATYLDYIGKWYDNDANNYNNSHEADGEYGGFFNDYTDDMCWICLTLMHMSDATAEEKYAETAKAVFDNYIWPRATVGAKGLSLPWTCYDKDRENRNACTNAPACLAASLLYRHFSDEKYLETAKTLYKFNIANMADAERVEEPPLSYTQGTFGEAARQLFHITGNKSYMDKAGQVLLYCVNSNRTTSDGILRHEGTSMDQSLFKAVFIPYAVNYVLDPEADSARKTAIKEKLLLCAKKLDSNMDRRYYPQMFCDYFWGTTFTSGTASMGAQASGASLLEGVARMTAALESAEQKVNKAE